MRIFTTLFLAGAAVAVAQRPSTEDLKQLLQQRLMKLQPDYVNQRTVLFQDVRALAPEGGNYPFEVTGIVHDYEIGFPRNHYYGKTCVGHMTNKTFTLRQEFGKWQIDGAMTISPGPELECKDNPAAGVSSLPLDRYQGAQARAGAVPAPAQAPAAAAQAGGAVRAGSYECWAFSSARAMMNFTIVDGSRYKDSNGQAGSYAVDGSGKMTFRGGLLDGVLPAGYSIHYYAPQGRPTASFRNPGGDEVSFCQWVR